MNFLSISFRNGVPVVVDQITDQTYPYSPGDVTTLSDGQRESVTTRANAHETATTDQNNALAAMKSGGFIVGGENLEQLRAAYAAYTA